MPHGRHGPPRAVLAAAIAALAPMGFLVEAQSPIVESAPLGPARRRYANAVVSARHPGPPAAILEALQAVERAFGRRRARRWGPRVLDLDLLAVGACTVCSPALTLPHPGIAHRAFVLGPLLAVAPGWRHPVSGLGVRHLHHRLHRPRPVAPRRPSP